MLRAMRRLFFIVMVVLWLALITLILVSPSTLDAIWEWAKESPRLVRVFTWIFFLPWMIGIAVWRSGMSEPVRWLLVIMLAVGWSAAAYPRESRTVWTRKGAKRPGGRTPDDAS